MDVRGVRSSCPTVARTAPASCLRSSRASASHELVAESMNGPDQRRQAPGLFDLGAQAMHVHVNRSFVTIEIEAPDALEQPVARERDAGVSRELEQQRELARLESNVGPVDACLARARIDLEAAELKNRPRRRNAASGAAQDRLDAHDDLARREGFRDEIIRPKFEAEHA